MLPTPVQLGPSARDLVRVYTEAARGPPSQPEVALVICKRVHVGPTVCWSILPPALLEQLLPRRQQIRQAAALATQLGPFNCPAEFRDKDVVAPCDSVAALAPMISGHSSGRDRAMIAGVLCLAISRLGA